MTKYELAKKVAEKTGIDCTVATAVLEEAAEIIKETLAEGDAFFMRGFGTFQVKHRAAKLGRNISKGTTINIPARNMPHFKPYREFTERVK